MIKPRVFRGMRDINPEEMFIRENLIEKFKEIFHLYGFVPLETPAVEYVDILEGKYGSECEKLIYKLAYNDGNTLALRYDLTVPLARFVAMNKNNIQFPFKRYQIQPVWRAERAQLRQGRYREFYQCDVDIVGTEDIKADADIIALSFDCIKASGIEDFVIRINDRNVLFGMIELAHLPTDKTIDILRIIDKLQKIGADACKDEILKLGCKEENVDELFDFLNLSIGEPEILRIAERVDKLKLGINTIKRLKDILDIIGLPEKNYRIDFHLARGLDYYTGLIFETIIPSMPYIGSLSGGGRYDELIKIFTGENIPSVGTTVGLDRIMTVLAELNILDEKKSETLIMFVNFRDEKLENVALKLVRDCRENGIPAELYYSGKKLRAQLEYANKLKIPYVGFLGENELKEGTVLLRNMNTGAETRLGLENFVMEFKRLISSGKS